MVRETHAAMPARGFSSVSLTAGGYDIVAISLPSLVSWL